MEELIKDITEMDFEEINEVANEWASKGFNVHIASLSVQKIYLRGWKPEAAVVV